MRVAFIVQGLPGEGYHGGALTCWAIVRALIRSGHQVCVISLFDITNDNPYLASRGRQEAALRAEGAEVVVVEYAMASLLGPCGGGPVAKLGRWFGRLSDDSKGLAYVMPWVALAEKVRVAMGPRPFDAYLCYHFDALAAVYPLRLSPLLAAVGDLWHLPAYFRWRESPVSLAKYSTRGLKVALESLLGQQAMSTLLKPTQSCGAFAGHYAEWLKTHGAPGVHYFRTPVPDVTGAQWEALRDAAHRRRDSNKPRLLVIGDLATTSTSSGLRAVAWSVLPRLIEQFGEDGFELRLVGGGSPPPELAQAFRHPAVQVVGRVVPADPEFLAADLMIVPTNIPLGIRVRVVTAWSFACPIVAHRANAAGIPEMQDGENALLADTDVELADAVSRALGNAALRRKLSRGGRQTFETWFSEAVAGQAIVDEMEHLVKGKEALRAIMSHG